MITPQDVVIVGFALEKSFPWNRIKSEKRRKPFDKENRVVAKVTVTKQLLEKFGRDLTEEAKQLLSCAEDIESLFPDDKGFTLYQAPPVNDAFPNVSDFVSQVLATIKAALAALYLLGIVS